MIEYDAGYWGVGFIWQIRGSVFHKAFCWALPNACIAAVMHIFLRSHFIQFAGISADKGISLGMSGYTMVLGFLLVFRTREAYNRWWESLTLLQALLIQWIITPVLMCILCEDPFWAATLAFLTNLFMWSINYVGEEIEEPFGDDANDLPLEAMQRSYNTSLVSLLMLRAQSPPAFKFDETHRVLRVSEYGSGNDPFVMTGTAGANEFRFLRKQDTTISRPSVTSYQSAGSMYTSSMVTGRDGGDESPICRTVSGTSTKSNKSWLSGASSKKREKKRRGFQNTNKFIVIDEGKAEMGPQEKDIQYAPSQISSRSATFESCEYQNADFSNLSKIPVPRSLNVKIAAIPESPCNHVGA